MKNLSLSLISLLLTLITSAQTITGSFGAHLTATEIKGVLVTDRGFNLPTDMSFSPTRAWALRANTSTGNLELWDGALWNPITGGGGSSVTISVASANGFAGSATTGSTPVITLSTTVTGLLKGNGTAISAAVAGTDYIATELDPTVAALIKAIPVSADATTNKYLNWNGSAWIRKQIAYGEISGTPAAGITAANLTLGTITGTSIPINIDAGTDVTLSSFTTANAGLVPAPGSVTGKVLSDNGSWITVLTSMVYPAAGIAVSTGSAWGTSIVDNSANWNTAFGWGNHATAGYLTSYTEIDPFAVKLTGNQTASGTKTWSGVAQFTSDLVVLNSSNTNTLLSITKSSNIVTIGNVGGSNYLDIGSTTEYHATTRHEFFGGDIKLSQNLGLATTAYSILVRDNSNGFMKYVASSNFLTSVPTLDQVLTAGSTSILGAETQGFSVNAGTVGTIYGQLTTAAYGGGQFTGIIGLTTGATTANVSSTLGNSLWVKSDNRLWTNNATLGVNRLAYTSDLSGFVTSEVDPTAVHITGNQTGIAGNKNWTGVHSFDLSAAFNNGLTWFTAGQSGSNIQGQLGSRISGNYFGNLKLGSDINTFTGSITTYGSGLTADRLYTMPNASGTLALTSDITGAGFITTETDPLSIKKSGSTALTGDVDISGGTFNTSITSNHATLPALIVQQLNTGNVNGMQVSTSGTGYGGFFSSAGGIGVYGNSSVDVGVHSLSNPTSTNTYVETMRVQRSTQGTAGVGIGGYIGFKLESASGNNNESGKLGFKLTDVTNSLESSQFDLDVKNGGTQTTRLSVLPTGQLQASAYNTSTAFTGTPVGTLQIDNQGKVIVNATTSLSGGGGGADPLGTYIVQTSTNAPANAQILASLGTGLVKNTTTTGVLSIATAGTDYVATESDPVYTANGVTLGTVQTITADKTMNNIALNQGLTWKSGAGSVIGNLNAAGSGGNFWGMISLGSTVNGNVGQILTPTLTGVRTWTMPDATGTVALTSDITALSSTYQPLDGDLTSIAGLAGTSGFLQKTAANTWTLNTTTLATDASVVHIAGTETITGDKSTDGNFQIGTNGASIKSSTFFGSLNVTAFTFNSVSTSTRLHRWFRSADASQTIAANNNYIPTVISAGSAITTASSGTHPIVAQMAFQPMALTANASTPASITTYATLYIDGAATGTATITNNYALYVRTGLAAFGGGVRMSGLSTATQTNILYIDGSGNLTQGAAPSGGSGTVNSGTANQLAYYASTGTAVSSTGTGFTYDGTTVNLQPATYNTSMYQFRVGDFIAQNYVLNNTFYADNAYFNGTSWVKINTGYAEGFQLYNGAVFILAYGSGSGTFTPNYTAKFDNTGTVALGGNIATSTGDYSGAMMVVTPVRAMLNGYFDIAEISPAPATPAASYGRIYAGSDSKLHYISDGGVDYDLTATGAGGGADALGTYIVQTATNAPANAQALASLSTGILKVTTTTGVLTTAVAADFPTLNQSTTGNAATATALANVRTIWGQNFDGTANVTGTLALSTASITMTGSIGSTGARVTKGWFTDAEFTNMPTVGGTSLSSTFQAADADLTTIAGLTATSNNFMVAVSSAWASVTPTTATSLLNTFTSTLKGLAPASGGGTANFLRADGTWAAPASGSGTVNSGTAGNLAYYATTGTAVSELTSISFASSLVTITTNVKSNGYFDIAEISPDPGTPASSYGRLYVGTDSKLHFNSDGGEKYTLSEVQTQPFGMSAPTASENAQVWYTPVALTITNVQEALAGTSPSVTYILGYASTRSGALTNIVNSHAATSTTGAAATLTANVVIPAGSYIVVTTSATSGTVNDFNLSISFRQ